MNGLKEKASFILRTMRYPESWALPVRIQKSLLATLSGNRPISAGTGTFCSINTPPVESFAFRRYLKGLKRISQGDRVPLVIHLAITDRCDYGCARCSNRFMKSPAGDPALPTLLACLEALKKAGTVSVAFTGGEPTLRQDLGALVEACVPEIAPLLFTSGQNMDPHLAQTLRSAGLSMALVSLDSDQEEEHDLIRNARGSYQKALRAIRCFLDQGIYTAVQAVVDSHCFSTPERINQFLLFCKTLAVHEVVLLDPLPRVGIGMPETPSKVSPAFLKELHRQSARNQASPKISSAAFLESGECWGCLAGYSFFYINTAGDLFPCDFVPLSFGNIQAEGLDALFARAASLIHQPCTRCQAVLLAQQRESNERWPMDWERTRQLFAQFPESPPSPLMRTLMPK